MANPAAAALWEAMPVLKLLLAFAVGAGLGAVVALALIYAVMKGVVPL